MKRFWFGVILLIVMAAEGFLVTWGMAKVHDPVAENLTQAGEYALSGNWDKAEQISRDAKTFWDTHSLFRACFADHTPMEEINACFGELEIYCRMREETAFAASCMEVSEKVKAMGEAHGLVWENLL